MDTNNFTFYNNINLPEPFLSDDPYLIMVNCISGNNIPQLNYCYINIDNLQIINNIELIQINLYIYNNIINIEKNITINNNISGNDLYEVIEECLSIENQYNFIKQLVLNWKTVFVVI